METRRLKNIAILILLLLNIFLLLLLAYHQFQSRQSGTNAISQLEYLFAADQLTLSDQLDLSEQALTPLVLSRDTETEAAMAAMLLGEVEETTGLGGGINSYTSANGSVQFRSGGGFDGIALTTSVKDPFDFAQEFFQTFEYVQTSAQLQGSTGTITGLQYNSGTEIIGCTVTLTFENNHLTAVSGTHITVENASRDGNSETLDSVTALVRFLDHRRSTGLVCRRIEEVHCIYQLNSSSSALRLTPIWQVDTDTYTCYVDCTTGNVFR